MTVIDLGYRPRQWQRECHIAKKRFTVLALHRRAGKSELALHELLDAALRFTEDLGLFFYIAPLLKQAKAIAWARLKQKVGPLVQHGMVTINESELWVRFSHNGAMIRVYGADNPDAMRGVRLDGVVIDEVAQTRPEVWEDIVQPALADRKGWALFIGTPNGVNLFSELYYHAMGREDWHQALYTVYDTESLDPKEVERLKGAMADQSWLREFMCDFAAAGDDQLLSLNDIMVAEKHKYRLDQYQHAPRILGVDPARFGDDRSVIFGRQGLVAFEPKVFRGIDNMTLAGHVAHEIQTCKPDAVFIDAGNGAGVIDRLRQLGFDITEVNFGGKPSQPRYSNKRSEMGYELREWILAGGSIPENVELRRDLAAPRYWFDEQHRIVLEPKDDIKKRKLPSPDLFDALGLTFAFPVNRQRHQQVAETTRQVLDYNPIATLRR